MTGSTKDYNGPCWSPWIWWDIDRDDDIDAATGDARRLVADLANRYELNGDELLVFYSGSKGFHVGLPTSMWQPEPSAAWGFCFSPPLNGLNALPETNTNNSAK